MFHSNRDRMTNTKEFHGMYRGGVVDVDDPMRAGRVRVRVFGVFDDFASQTIPWALYADSFMGGIGGSGGFFIPPVGSHVFVFFEAGDPTQPVFFAGAPAMNDGPPERSSNYPQNRVYKSPSGHLIEINDGAGIIHIQHNSGTEVTIQADGSVIENVVANLTRNITGDVTETIDGNYTRNVGGSTTEATSGEVTITGSRIDLN